MDNKVLKVTLTVKDRKNVVLDGVNNIEGFDETYISLSTDLGRVVIEGRDLKVESLSKETATIQISGHINGVYYSEDKGAKKSIFRLFK